MSGSINDLSWHALGATMMDASQASRLGEAAKARTDTYQSGLSHGASRFFKGLFSFGINEIWRAIRTSNYNKDMAKIASGLENFYNALAPELVQDERDKSGMTLSYDGVKCESVELPDRRRQAQHRRRSAQSHRCDQRHGGLQFHQGRFEIGRAGPA